MRVTCGIIGRMTTAQRSRVPAWTLGWRLKRALSEGDVSREKMADLLDVTPSTISRWMADKGAPPRRPYVAAWAAATGVDLDWLLAGETPRPEPTPSPGAPTPRPELLELTERSRARAQRSATRVYLTAA